MTATTAGAAPPALTHRQILTVFAGIGVGLFLAALDQTIVGTALPRIVSDLGGVDQLSWVIVGYLLTSTATTPLWGKLGDLFGRRRVFQAAIVAFLAGSALCGLAQSMAGLALFRAVQGIGGGGLYALAFAIIADVVSPRERGRYIGYFTAIFASAAVMGPLVGGFLADHVDWRWIFYINLPLGAGALVVTSFALRLPFPRRRARLDLVGAALLMAGVTALVLVTQWGGHQHPWGSPLILALLIGGVGLAAAFVWWERRAEEPLVPLRLFANPVAGVAFALSFLLGSILYSTPAYLPLFLQAVTGVSATNSGLLISPQMLGMTLMSVVAGRVMTRTGRYKHLIIGGTAVFVVAMVALSRIGASTPAVVVGGLMVLVGVAIGANMPTLSTATQNAVEVRDLGTATSSLTFFRSLGGSFGVAAFGMAFNHRLNGRLAEIAARAELPEGVTARDLANRPASIRAIAEPLRTEVVDALAHGVSGVFLAAVPVTVAALAGAWFLRELPLRTHTTLSATAPSTAPPTPATPALE